jgi:Outer membrane protein beta-barrel domain
MSFKNLLLILFFAAFANTALAQNNTNNTEEETLDTPTEGRRFGAQLLAGFNAAQLDGDGMTGYNHLGVNAGVRVYVRVSPKFTTSLDLIYTQTGAQAGRFQSYSSAPTGSQGGGQVQAYYTAINLDYVQIPLMVHYSDWKVRFGAGLSYARLINAQSIYFATGKDDGRVADYNRNYEVSMHLEGTYLFNEKWGVQLGYTRGLINTDSRNVEFADIRVPGSLHLYSHILSMRALYNL